MPWFILFVLIFLSVAICLLFSSYTDYFSSLQGPDPEPNLPRRLDLRLAKLELQHLMDEARTAKPLPEADPPQLHDIPPDIAAKGKNKTKVNFSMEGIPKFELRVKSRTWEYFLVDGSLQDTLVLICHGAVSMRQTRARDFYLGRLLKSRMKAISSAGFSIVMPIVPRPVCVCP
jgi:hypothetical protein